MAIGDEFGNRVAQGAVKRTLSGEVLGGGAGVLRCYHPEVRGFPHDYPFKSSS
jgi:hypothetical protein